MGDDLFSVEKKVILVTGSTRGLGWAMAQGLANAGALVLINGRREADAAERVKEIRSGGGEADACAFDVTDLDRSASAVRAISNRFGRLDVLINNAGIVIRSSLLETTDEQWQQIIDTNLTQCFRLSREAARIMATQHWGRIVMISSVMGTIARPSIASYVTAKTGLHGLARALAVELAPEGINVNCVAPGFFPSDANTIIRDDPKFNELISRRTPHGRWGNPSELLGAIIYFSSEASSYCTGQVLTVDGGMTVALGS